MTFSKDYLLIIVLPFWSIKQLAEIFSNTEETKSSQVKGEQHLIELFKTLLLTYEKSDEYKRERAEREKIMKGMQKN